MGSTKYHPVVDRIKNLLEQHACEYEFFEHEPVRTSEEAAKVRSGYSLKQGAKAIVARIKEPGKGKRFVMFVLPADRRFNNEKIRHNLGFKDIRFATEEEVAELTNGILPGGVPPFGTLFGLEIFADSHLFENEKIAFNAGDRRASIGMKSSDYQCLVAPILVDIIWHSRSLS